MGREDNTQSSIMSETAKMLDDGSICVNVLSDSANGAMGHGEFTLPKSHADYESYRKRFGLEKPGDWRTIETREVNGERFEVDGVEADFSSDD